MVREGLRQLGNGRDVMFLLNATPQEQLFIIPAVAKGTRWRLFIDTAAESPEDIYPSLNGPPPPKSRRVKLIERSLRCYVAEK